MTNYEEFKAIADDLSELYANGYEDYANYFSNSFADFGAVSAVSRISDKAFSLRGFLDPNRKDYGTKEFVADLKSIAIEAILTIGEVSMHDKNDSDMKPSHVSLEIGARYLCRIPLMDYDGSPGLILGKIYLYEGDGTFSYTEDRTKVYKMTPKLIDKHLQKIIEKK